MASSVPKKRIRVSRKPKASRNPLFEKWLQEMLVAVLKMEILTPVMKSSQGSPHLVPRQSLQGSITEIECHSDKVEKA